MFRITLNVDGMGLYPVLTDFDPRPFGFDGEVEEGFRFGYDPSSDESLWPELDL